MEDEKEPLREMGVREFVRRLRNNMDGNEDSRFVFFLGAGCSVSSGIPDAGALVRTWLQELKGFKTGDKNDSDDWAKKHYHGYDGTNAASYYGMIINERFSQPEERQREIERLTERNDPSFGYAVLAKLMTHERYGRHCNAVLTVNFDDLVADALYLYTHKKPLIISHESLVGFVRVTRTRPLVIKLHGDARLEPKNTEKETKELSNDVKEVLKNFLSEMALIFVGYGGNDKSITEILNELPGSSLRGGIYWIGKEIPENNLGEWLKERKAIWVKHRDFDELMLLMWYEFELDHPDEARFKNLTTKYYETFDNLKNRVEEKPEGEIKEFSDALNKALDEATSAWKIRFEARQFEKTDPDKADAVYQVGLKKFSESGSLIGSYARFLHIVRKDYDMAEEYYKKALDIEPDNAAILWNYAIFLAGIRKDYDKAETYYNKAVDIDSENANKLGGYANFLADIHKNYDKAELYYKKALDIEPRDANNLENYAIFLAGIRKDYDKAGKYYKKALDIEPRDANNLGNYAGFLLATGDEKGFDLLSKAIGLAENDPLHNDLMLECQFYRYAHIEDPSSRADAINKIRDILRNNVRSPGWDLSENVQRAIYDGHPDPEFLTQLSKVISDEIDIKELDKFEEWKEK